VAADMVEQLLERQVLAEEHTVVEEQWVPGVPMAALVE